MNVETPEFYQLAKEIFNGMGLDFRTIDETATFIRMSCDLAHNDITGEHFLYAPVRGQQTKIFSFFIEFSALGVKYKVTLHNKI